jgi:hypothetical protein
VVGVSQGLGGLFAGQRASLLLSVNGGAPTSRTDEHNAGEIYFDDNNDLWVCTADGTPGTWRKLTGTTLTPVTPFRVHDSRFGGGRITKAAPRVISVKDAIDPSSGATTAQNSVPAGATGIAFNLTITNTVGGGFLAMTPGDATTSASASVNWTGTGQTIGNGGIAKLDTNRQVKLFADHSGGGGADAIIDVIGFFA